MQLSLYSKQGNTAITELVVLDELTQCNSCKEQFANGKSFLTCGLMLQELSAEKTETLQETT